MILDPIRLIAFKPYDPIICTMAASTPTINITGTVQMLSGKAVTTFSPRGKFKYPSPTKRIKHKTSNSPTIPVEPASSVAPVEGNLAIEVQDDDGLAADEDAAVHMGISE